ncbi:ribonuclease H-like domain-containing protein [Tanacetum coccineum]
MYAVRCTRPDVAFAQNITSRFQLNPGELHWTTVKNNLKYLRNTKDMFDADDLKSQTGYVFVLNGGAVDWKSTKQPIAIAKDHGVTKGARHFRAKVHYLRETTRMGDVRIEKVDTYDNLADPFTKALAFLKHSKLTEKIRIIPANSLITLEGSLDFGFQPHLGGVQDFQPQIQRTDEMPRGSTDPDDDNLCLLPNVDILATGKRKLEDKVAPTSDPQPIPQRHCKSKFDNANVNAHEMSPASTNPNDNNLSKEGVGNSNDRPQPPVSISSVKHFPVLTAIDTDMALTVVLSGPTLEYTYMGNFDQICQHCDAFFWYEERARVYSKGVPQYHRCLGGRISLPKHQECPPYISNAQNVRRRFLPNRSNTAFGSTDTVSQTLNSRCGESSSERLLRTGSPFASSHGKEQDPAASNWNMDTGASSHLNDYVSSLSNVFNSCIYPSVSVGDSYSILVTNYGHCILPTPHRPLHLNNVLITPSIVKNLIYVCQFVRDNFCIVEFDAFGFSVKDFLTRPVLLRCDSTGDLYLVTKPSTFPSAFLTNTNTAYLLLYVDDIVPSASSEILLQWIIASLHTEFSMTDLGSLNYFMGVIVTRDSSGMFLSQRKYATRILERAHMVSCNSSRTPVDTESKLGDDGDSVSDPMLYRSLAGSLQYLTFTRPDISFCSTTDDGLQLFSSSTSSLVAYLDVDWVVCPTTRRSTSCYCVFIGNNLLFWSSKRQPMLSYSSAKAKYRSVANVVVETCWLRNLPCKLHTPLSSATLVYCDNVSVIYLSSNPVQHQRTNHIEIDIHIVRDLVAAGQVRVLHVPSQYQYVDIFTK